MRPTSRPPASGGRSRQGRPSRGKAQQASQPSQGRVKIGKCHETDKYPTKSDENWPIWSQTGQGNLSRRVPDPKNARGVVKNEGVQVWAPFVRKGGGCRGCILIWSNDGGRGGVGPGALGGPGRALGRGSGELGGGGPGLWSLLHLFRVKYAPMETNLTCRLVPQSQGGKPQRWQTSRKAPRQTPR